MARKPNYDFERRERERAKVAKAAERQKAKAARTEAPAAEGDAPPAERPEDRDRAS